jgi:hypothetical protein
MKKIFVLFSFVCITLCSFGQINVIVEFKSHKKIATIRASYSYLYQTESGYEFVSRTSNKFDDNFYFFLGEDVESAVHTCEDLIVFLEDADFENGIVTNKDKRCTISKMSILGADCFYLMDSKHAGSCNITKKELNKIIKKLKSIKE